MVHTFRFILVSLVLILVVGACSTEKNTLMNRTYHGMTARYNGHFNANELLRQSLTAYRSSLKENFYDVLPIDPLPNEQEVVGLYPAIDTAIVKCTKVIQRHSMPSNDRPSLKKEEHNAWIDENWTTIGIASFYRRDYDAAMKNFMFVKKFYSNDPSIYIGELWMAKTNIQLGKLTEAGFNIAALDKAIEAEEAGGDTKTKEKPKKGSKKSSKKEEEPEIAKVPKSIRFDFEKTKAEYALRKNEPQNAIKYLEASLEFAKKSDKARVYFIIAQLYESTGNRGAASENYTKSLKYIAPYELHFNARLKRAFMGGDEKVRKELLKMLRDAKNAEFKDQIYYALADMELQGGEKAKAIEYLTLSAFYSTSNTRQKGMSYEKMGDLSFADRNYVKAQKYYDSCGTVIDDTYPNAAGVRNKADKLADLVKAVETAQFEDSVQRIARMSDGEREDFLKGVIKKMKEDEERRKKMEAERLRELQANQNLFVQTEGNASKWYFNNPKTRSEGFDEFRKLWGPRENEDDWRRSDRTSFLPVNTEESDTAAVTETAEEEKSDTLTVESLMVNIPLTDSALVASNERLLEALYNAGVIYKEQLNEFDMAKKQFDAVLARNTTGEFDMSAAYQLYKMNETSNPDLAAQKKDYIITTYPNSDYANYLRDPDFFVKRKEREALAEQEYVKVLERYNRGLYYPVISKADIVIEQEKDNKYRSKYMLLKAMCLGQTTDNKQELLPILDRLIDEYPGTPEATRAQEMIDIIKNGYSKNIEAEFGKNKFPFTYVDNAEHWVIVFLDKEESSNMAKTKVADFNREFFSRAKLKVTSKIYGDDQSIILIQQFKDEMEAEAYMRVFKETRKHLMDLQKAKIIVITQENMKILFETKKLQEYEDFYTEFY